MPHSDEQDGDTLSPTEKPLALKLADQLEDQVETTSRWSADKCDEAAAELRRLHADNEALREALTRLLRWAEADNVNYTGDHPVAQARAALTGGKT